MIAGRFAGLSTGIKMLIILSAALLPLGLIAILASLESANTNRFTREAAIRMIATDASRNLDDATTELSRAMTAMLDETATGPPAPAACRRSLDILAQAQPPGVRYGLFDLDDRLICGTVGFRARRVHAPSPGIGTEAALVQDGRLLRIIVARGGLLAVAEIPRATLTRIAALSHRADPAALTLWQGEASLPIAIHGALDSSGQTIRIASPVAGGQLALELTTSAVPIRVEELLMILLPVLMWLAAGLIGWLVIDRLVLKPLARLQHAIATYDITAGPLRPPPMKTPSQEIRSLAEALAGATVRQARHEAELAEGLARQTRLTREVHHRVKNNLQVVSSLINLHSRGARGEEAQDAYAAIQRRVDALAIVHRNHYAEMEDNRGVGLRTLIGELASNLRGTATGEAAAMPVRLELMAAATSQDVAVPVAFLITEVAEMVMDCDPHGGLTIRLRPTETAGRARLELIAPGLAGDACRGHPAAARFERVIEGLSRQLRAPLAKDGEQGHYAIDIPIIAPAAGSSDDDTRDAPSAGG